MPEDSIDYINFDELNRKAISQPLVKHIFTADPSAHVFNGKIYIYPSHDIEAGIPFDEKWYLFYHDSGLSKGVTHLRSVKMTDLKYDDDGSIQTINAYKK